MLALLRANARFWSTVLPEVRSELRSWDRRAEAIPDPALRRQALAKLRDERFNTEVAATLATLVPSVRRRAAVEAIVAFQVAYDYLDGLTEQPVARPLAAGRQLYRAFADALAPAGPPVDHYRAHPRRDDGGYLQALAATARRAFWSLPAASAVAPAARAVAARCGEAQTRTHAIPLLGADQLRAWALGQPESARMRWWEIAAGGAASVLALHALVALAADPATVPLDGERLAAAYLPTCALTTLLDSLVDAEQDAVRGGHAYLAYYRDEAETATRLGALAREAVAAAAVLPRAADHLTIVAGAVAFYLSAPAAGEQRALRLTERMACELQPMLGCALPLFGAWRGAKRRRAPAGAGVAPARARPRARRARPRLTTERGSVERGGRSAGSYGGMKRAIPGTMAACKPPLVHRPASPPPSLTAGPASLLPSAPPRPPARSATSSSATGSSSAPHACAR